MQKIIVHNKANGSYLQSPYVLDGNQRGREEIWPWGSRSDQAHHFSSRGEAKAKIRSLGPEGWIRMKDLSFQNADSVALAA